MNNLIRVVAIKVATEPRFTSGQIEVITSKVLVITMTEYVTNDPRYDSFVVITILSFPHS
jgi:hypothetical protein